MRVLLDECLPRQLKRELTGHDVRTVPEMGWAGKSNGELLQLASGEFDVFVTVDRGIQYQQNLAGGRIGVIAMAAPSNDVDALRPLLPDVLKTIPSIQPGQFLRVGA